MVWSNSGTVPQLSPGFLELGKDPCPKPGTQQHPGLAQEEEEEEEHTLLSLSLHAATHKLHS